MAGKVAREDRTQRSSPVVRSRKREDSSGPATPSYMNSSRLTAITIMPEIRP